MDVRFDLLRHLVVHSNLYIRLLLYIYIYISLLARNKSCLILNGLLYMHVMTLLNIWNFHPKFFFHFDKENVAVAANLCAGKFLR